MDLKTGSRLFFALTMIAVGVMGLIEGGFAPIWRPVPEAVPGREILALLCIAVSLASGAGLLTKRTAAPAALVLTLYLIAWTTAFKVPFIIRAPLEEVSYQSTGESIVLVASAWVLFAGTANDRRLLASEVGVRTAYSLYGLALIAFGLSHFVYLQMTAPLVPGWLPGPPTFWAYLTGGCYLAAGVAIIAGVRAPLAAMLAAVQITGITLLVWGPMVLAGQLSATHWQETVVSWALTAAAWVLASGWQPSSKA